MTTSRADKAKTKAPAALTTYEISIRIPSLTPTFEQREGHFSWEPEGRIPATSARAAIRLWVEDYGSGFAGGVVRATPVSMITETLVGLHTKTEITIDPTTPKAP